MTSIAHDRILEIPVTCDESDNSIVATDVRWYRDRAHLNASDPFTIDATPGAASATGHEIVLNEVIPIPSIIRLVPTFQA